MNFLDSLEEKDFHKLLDFLEQELNNSNQNKSSLSSEDYQLLLDFLENRYLEVLNGHRIVDIHLDSGQKKLYLETPFFVDSDDGEVVCIDQFGKAERQILTPEHPFFDLYIQEDDTEDN